AHVASPARPGVAHRLSATGRTGGATARAGAAARARTAGAAAVVAAIACVAHQHASPAETPVEGIAQRAIDRRNVFAGAGDEASGESSEASDCFCPPSLLLHLLASPIILMF